VFDSLIIQSHKGPYEVTFSGHISFADLDSTLADCHFIIDRKVADIYAKELATILNSPSVLLLDAIEENKCLSQFPNYVEHLVKHKLRKKQRLVAIGGGIIQDTTCFLAATMLRGVDWWFYPTTLLSQADSCIGSKSSVNCRSAKNILGTFTPPSKIFIQAQFLQSLSKKDLCSGVGEMLKIHAIEAPESFDRIAKDYSQIFSDSATMLDYIKHSLKIKQALIEQDEFDQGVRNILNYGHTFGHAIESATNYEIPHGLAVTLGMDMANFVAHRLGFVDDSSYKRMHPVLKKNFEEFVNTEIPMEAFSAAISKDKKNVGMNKIGLILPDINARPARFFHEKNTEFDNACLAYLREGRN